MAWEEIEKAGIRAYYKDDAVFIINADCREVLPELPKVDLVLTDPPYNENYDYRGSGFKDSSVDYYGDIEFIVSEGERLLNDSGSFYLKHSSRQIDKIIPIISRHLTYRTLIIWISNSQAHPKENYDSYYEPIYFYTKTDSYTFNKRAEYRQKPKDYWSGEGKEFVGLLVNCWYDIPKVQAGCLRPEGLIDGNLKLHPCSMPLTLAQRAINVSTNPGAIILDPYLGSGTTAFAAKKLNRHCIGIEIEEKYCEIAAKRCSQEVMGLEI